MSVFSFLFISSRFSSFRLRKHWTIWFVYECTRLPNVSHVSINREPIELIKNNSTKFFKSKTKRHVDWIRSLKKIFCFRMGTDLTRSEINMVWSSSGFQMDQSIPFSNLIRQIIIFSREENQLMISQRKFFDVLFFCFIVKRKFQLDFSSTRSKFSRKSSFVSINTSESDFIDTRTFIDWRRTSTSSSRSIGWLSRNFQSNFTFCQWSNDVFQR